ncbi:MAG: acetyl-CoA acetyltransferase [Chrysiogenetes bacterium]|nr:acetyl-CoA acetyltransferase [Chrysiogenetes bacterium]
MAGSIKDKVAIVGAGCVKFGDNFERSYTDMATEAGLLAMKDAGIESDRIEAAWLGTYLPNNGLGKAGSSISDPLHLYGIPITRVENYCATGTDAFRNAAIAVASGMYDVVLVLGCEKMKDRAARGIPRVEHPSIGKGTSAPALFALAANRYMKEFGMTRETLAKVAVKNHYNGARNKLAHMQKEVTEDQVLSAPMISYPFGLFDCCPTTDGAAALILCKAEIAKQFRDDPVLVKGVGLAAYSHKPYYDPTFDYLGFLSTQKAASMAYEMAGVKDPAKEIDLAEVHDCFTWTEITNYEDLGFCKKGEGRHLIEEGRTALTGDIPVNPSGGLKSFGHPIGASGVRMLYEVTTQLRGQGGERQVKDARLGLAHNVGGPGAVSCVSVLGRAD